MEVRHAHRRLDEHHPETPGADGNPAFGYAGLAVDPEHPDTVMVATNDRWYPVDTIFRSTDAGATWDGRGRERRP